MKYGLCGNKYSCIQNSVYLDTMNEACDHIVKINENVAIYSLVECYHVWGEAGAVKKYVGWKAEFWICLMIRL